MKKISKMVLAGICALMFSFGAFVPAKDTTTTVSAKTVYSGSSCSGFVDIFLYYDSNGYKHYERLYQGRHYSYWMTR